MKLTLSGSARLQMPLDPGAAGIRACVEGTRPALAGLHGNSELSFALLEIIMFLDIDVACIAEDKAFIPMKPGCCCVQLMHVGGDALNKVDQASAGSTPIWQRIRMTHCLPLATECISGSFFSHSVSGSHPGGSAQRSGSPPVDGGSSGSSSHQGLGLPSSRSRRSGGCRAYQPSEGLKA